MAAVILQAQPRTGEIRLDVKDPSGAATEASVKIQNPLPGWIGAWDRRAGPAYL